MSSDPRNVGEFISWLNAKIAFLESHANTNSLSSGGYLDVWKDAHGWASEHLSPSDVELLEPQPTVYVGGDGRWTAIHKLKRLRDHLTGDNRRTETPPAPTAPPTGEGRQAEGREISERQRLILQTMLEHQITSERRRQRQPEIVRSINRQHSPGSYTRDFAELVKRGYLQSREGPKGGTWIDPNRKADAEQVLKDD